MRRLTALLTVLTVTSLILWSCGGDSGTGPDPDNANNENEEATTYTVSVNMTPSDAGTISPSADDTYEEGEEVEVQANPNDEYRFIDWTGDVESSDNPLSLVVDQDYSLTANFEKKSYALTTNTEGEGAIDENVVQKKSTDYEHSTVVELTANPADGWKFVEWTGDVTGTGNPQQVTVDSPKEVTAVFEKKSYELTINKQGEGAVAEEVVQAKSYEHGTVVDLTANAAIGWTFSEWQGDLTGNSNPEKITIDRAKEVTVVFESKPFYVSSNGVTIICDVASVGDTGTINGTTYTKRNKSQITPANAPTTCTSGITDMSNLFNGAGSFNGDISHWDVSSVTDMQAMFMSATDFNQDLSSWDVSGVTNMRSMFNGATPFNQDLSGWDVSSVTDMQTMFINAESFNGDLSSWDVSAVTDMRAMFVGATIFSGDISSWNVSSANDMAYMFQDAKAFNGDINSWDVSSVTQMHKMFDGAGSFNQDLSDWDVSNVTTMAGMFRDASSFNQDISGWCVENFDSKPSDFDDGAGFEGDDDPDTGKQPVWGTCPGN
ncbi:BspA family leucine-rich repeat surface protein [Fodinibius sp. Rm-B-1B1-1]|uniref:BspA family leucine-rich repeat surface protein n=1 Tax=Fodinibius alkaliphilus TaxID=3140241 RepID=UPI00315ACCA0